MSKEKRAYRAADPKAVRESLDRWQVERKAFFGRVRDFEMEHFDGAHTIAVVSNGDGMWARQLYSRDPSRLDHDTLAEHRIEGRWTPRGKMHDGEIVAPIPPGWHYYKTDDEVRVHQGGRDADAKAARAAIKALNDTSPGDLRDWLRQHFGVDEWGYGFEPVGDTFYVLLNPNRMLRKGWDGNEHFEKVPMSTYWLDRESAEDDEAGAA